MKKLLAYLLALVMVFGLVGCSSGSDTSADAPVEEETSDTVYTVGMVCIGNEEMAYDRNFYHAADAAKEILAGKGINIECKYTYDHPEGDPVAEDCIEFAEDGAIAVFLNSYGMENAMLSVAADYPDTVFAALTNEGSKSDDLDNTVNAFPSIYEGRYLAGVAAGMKLNEMIAAGQFTAEEAKMGYVGAFTYAEVISGYTSFYLGAKSVCPTVTMDVQFTGSWYDAIEEENAAKALIARGCKLISQHADSMGAPSACEAAGIPNVSYNGSTVATCENTFIVSSKINWAPYFEYIINCVTEGKDIDTDWTGTIATESVQLCEVNTKVAAAGTVEKLDAVKKDLVDGKIHVFDTKNFTKDGNTLTSYMADVNTDDKFTPDTEAIENGIFYESKHRSAPYFDIRIDNITLLNEKY